MIWFRRRLWKTSVCGHCIVLQSSQISIARLNNTSSTAYLVSCGRCIAAQTHRFSGEQQFCVWSIFASPFILHFHYESKVRTKLVRSLLWSEGAAYFRTRKSWLHKQRRPFLQCIAANECCSRFSIDAAWEWTHRARIWEGQPSNRDRINALHELVCL